jgi:hypothetical protein
MTDSNQASKASGEPVTDELMQALADEAEAGRRHGVRDLKLRRIGRTRPSQLREWAQRDLNPQPPACKGYPPPTLGAKLGHSHAERQAMRSTKARPETLPTAPAGSRLTRPDFRRAGRPNSRTALPPADGSIRRPHAKGCLSSTRPHRVEGHRPQLPAATTQPTTGRMAAPTAIAHGGHVGVHRFRVQTTATSIAPPTPMSQRRTVVPKDVDDGMEPPPTWHCGALLRATAHPWTVRITRTATSNRGGPAERRLVQVLPVQ